MSICICFAAFGSKTKVLNNFGASACFLGVFAMVWAVPPQAVARPRFQMQQWTRFLCICLKMLRTRCRDALRDRFGKWKLSPSIWQIFIDFYLGSGGRQKKGPANPNTSKFLINRSCVSAAYHRERRGEQGETTAKPLIMA